MKTVLKSRRAWGLCLALICVASVSGAGAPLEYVKTRTIQNLAPRPSSFSGFYLNADFTGQVNIIPENGFFESGTYWEIKKTFWKERGYTTHTIVQRGSSPFNNQYLALDPDTGALVLAKEEVPTSRWLIRYAGKYAGWDSFYIQNMGETGAFDMQFLAIDEASGAVMLTPKPTPGSHWFLNETSYLPAETLLP